MDISFERTVDGKDEWLTPQYITQALGNFALDPCAPIIRPWDTANSYFTIEDDGLSKEWFGRVWCNPPYGNATGKWLEKLDNHGNGIALIFARTETNNFKKYIWESKNAKGIFFIYGRLAFYHVDGTKALNSAGAPSCLVAYGENNAQILKYCTLKGKYLSL